MKHLLLILMMSILAFAPGCNILGFMADKTTTGETEDARYVLANERTVVVAENWRNPNGTEIDADEVGRLIFENLRAHNAAPLIDPTVITDLHSKHPDFHKLSVAQIGKLAGAQQVIYVNITDTSEMQATGSETMHSKGTARVKVIDVQSGHSIWPIDSVDGYPVSISTPMTLAHSDNAEEAEHQHLMGALADRVSRLFYEAPLEE